MVFSLFALTLLLPLFCIVIAILSLTGEREVFYRQVRVGLNKDEFQILKFATMLKDSPQLGTGTVTVKDDPRVLPFGKFLRKTKINELPQLLNVLCGHMSLIGPRPLTPNNFAAYDVKVQDKITKIRPGLSGIGSIYFRDEESILADTDDPLAFYRDKIAPYKGKLECWFVDNRSIKVYFVLIILTIIAVVFPKSNFAKNIYSDLPELEMNE